MSDERLSREKAYHDQRFGGDNSERSAARKYYSLMNKAGQEYRSVAIATCGNGHLLEYGCGTGRQSQVWLRTGARITGIDISSEAIEKAKTTIMGTEFADRAEYYEMNAEAMSFKDDTFDVIVGSGIIHHLELDPCYSELARVLKPGGLAVFMEPLGHNYLINFYRKLTPGMRTEDEHPLRMEDIRHAERYFNNVKASYYNLTTLLAVPFRKTFLFKPLFNMFHQLDRALFKVLPFLRKHAWFIVLQMRDPRLKSAS